MSRWAVLRPMSTERSHCGAATSDGKLFVFGGGGLGFKSLQSAEVYDPGLDRWSEITPMPTLRSGLVAVSLQNLIFVMGGGFKKPDGTFNFLTVVEIFDSSGYSWQNGPPLRKRHDAPSAINYQERIYLFAGHHPEAIGGPLTDPAFSCSERFSVKANQWEEIAPLPTPRFSLGTAVVDDKIWVMGGGAFKDGRFQNFNLIEIFDPKNEKWGRREDLKLPWPSAGISVCTWKERVFIFGGNDGERISNRSAVYNPKGNQWEELEPMPEPRAAASAAVIKDRIYLVGGRDASGKNPTNSLLAYSPSL
ncbi:MAG: Kelch repeat-containing protein [Nitrospiria bacterium]